jgi:hypothetical protein
MTMKGAIPSSFPTSHPSFSPPLPLSMSTVGKGEGSRVGKIPWNLQTVMLVSVLIVLVIIAIQLDTLIALKTAEVCVYYIYIQMPVVYMRILYMCICVYYRCPCNMCILYIPMYIDKPDHSSVWSVVCSEKVQQTGGDVTVTGEEQKKGKKPASKTS